MKLLEQLKTVLKPTLKPVYDRQDKALRDDMLEKTTPESWWAVTTPDASEVARQLTERRSRTAILEAPTRARPQSDALRGLLKRAHAIGSSN